MVNKKESIRLIWSETIVRAWPHSARAHDWTDHGRVHIGDTKNRNKTCELENIYPSNKWVWILCECKCDHVWSGCIVVDWWCRGSNGKAKIEGYMWVSDEKAHHWGFGINWWGLQYQTSHFFFFQLGASGGSSLSILKHRLNVFYLAPPERGMASIIEYKSQWFFNGGSSLWVVRDAAQISRRSSILLTDIWQFLKRRLVNSNSMQFSYGHHSPWSSDIPRMQLRSVEWEI